MDRVFISMGIGTHVIIVVLKIPVDNIMCLEIG